MTCKLFDRVAFGNHHRISEADKFVLSIQSVRRSVLLDASDLFPTYVDWWDAEPRKAHETFKRCLSPFRNVFVYAGERDGIASGMHVESLRSEDPPIPGKRFSVFEACKMQIRDHPPVCEQDGGSGRVLEAIENCGEILRIIVWGMRKDGTAEPGDLVSYVVLSPDGEFITVFAGAAKRGDRAGLFGEQSAHHYTFPLFVNQLTHCRNIVTVSHDPYRPEMPRGRRNKIPKVRFHTIRISDSLVKSDAPALPSDGGGVAKHVCRGNFARYTEENKLFGKYVGMFWRPMHIRGKAKHGIVGKDYVMEAPQ